MTKGKLFIIIMVVPAYLLTALCLVVTFSRSPRWSSYDQDEWFLSELFKRERELLKTDNYKDAVKLEPTDPAVAYELLADKIIHRMSLSPEGRRRLERIQESVSIPDMCDGGGGEYVLEKLCSMEDEDSRLLRLLVEGLRESRRHLVPEDLSVTGSVTPADEQELYNKELGNEQDWWKRVLFSVIDQMALSEKGRERLRGLDNDWTLHYLPPEIKEYLESKNLESKMPKATEPTWR